MRSRVRTTHPQENSSLLSWSWNPRLSPKAIWFPSNRPMLITFSGLDGSGKSTLIACLKENLERDHQRVAVSHMNYDVGIYPMLRSFLKTAGDKQPAEHGGFQE